MDDITLLLDRVAQGDKRSENDLFDAVYRELRKVAAREMRRERASHSLQPTALVNEAYLRLTGNRGLSWESRVHFYNTAALTMRRILIDHARSHKATKRDAGIRVDFEGFTATSGTETAYEDLIALDGAIERLKELDERAARVVELRFFAGLSVEEAARVLGVSEKTVKRDWEFSRAWLETQLKPRSQAASQ